MRGLKSTVLSHDMCIGCGACAFLEPGKYAVAENPDGFIKAFCLSEDSESEVPVTAAEQVCPFGDSSLNEDVIAHRVFEENLPHDTFIGKHIACFAGRVSEESIYQASSSGGIGRWILSELLKEGLVDGVIAVLDRTASQPGQKLFEYGICRDPNELAMLSKSAYYPVEMSKVLAEVRETPGRYAITGVPCFIKAIRNLCEREPVLKDRICFTVGIVCGHLKSRYYAELLGWQLGVEPSDLRSIDFRKKLPGKRANEKGVTATRISDPGATVPPKTVKEMFGTDYGLGYFKYNACDYCDDVVAETADISIGDAWLPEHMESGTSLVIVRNRKIYNLINEANSRDYLKLANLTAHRAYTSQAAGFRHRREGLAYRLHKNENKSWLPKKRVEPSSLLCDARYRKIFDIRERVVWESVARFKQAKAKQSLSYFEESMRSIERAYSFTYSSGFKLFVRILLAWLHIDERRVLKLLKK